MSVVEDSSRSASGPSDTSPLPSSASSVGSANLLDGNQDAENANFGDMQPDCIAIIGLSIKLPGDASSVEPFWNLMMQGHCTATKVPADRYNVEAYHSLDSSTLGTVRPKIGHFLKEDLSVFDSTFFGFSEAETIAMDPQQRGLLETTYLALENAGLPMEKIYGTETSVHMGCFAQDYMLMMAKDPEMAPKYGSTGVASSMIANRISSFFNLKGVSVSLDTACSSSLVALHQSCQTLQLRQSSLGIVGGCNITATLDTTIGLSSLGFLSPDGVCHSFDHRANGYARGEGFGVVILKRLSDAIREGDTIRAVIRAAGSNQDGNTPLAQPSKEAQVQLMESTYRAAGLDPAETSYVEAHGTGTAIGDPLEARAIGQVFSMGRARSEPIYVGSLKANFGHLEGAAGIAGLVKAVLALERGMIPPLAELEKINPDIDADFLNIKFNTTPIPWPCRGLRRASVNSFGFGGTNAHVILDDAYHYMHQRGLKGNHCTAIIRPSVLDETGQQSQSESLLAPTSDAPLHPVALVWSAMDESGLGRMLSHYVDWFPSSLGHSKLLPSLAYTLLERRSLFPWRSLAVSDPLECQGKLQPSKPIRSRHISELSLAFVFTGQGAQWSGMGKELFVYDVFKQSILDAASYLASLGCDWSVAGALTGELDRLDDPAIAQPICTILQVALVQLLASVNILPSAVIGHSSGEIAAAYACGAISRESAWKLAYFRGVCSSKLAATPDVRGAMISVGLSMEDAQQQIVKITDELGNDGKLTVACVNSPTNVTVSGDEAHIKALETRLTAISVFSRLLRVPVAYHGPHMNRVSDMYFNSIGHIAAGYSSPGKQVNMVSSVTGKKISQEQLQSPAYWIRNLVSQVKFMQAVQATFPTSERRMPNKLDFSHLKENWTTDMLEIGPHATLSGPIRDSLQVIPRARDVKYQSILVRKQHSYHTMLNAAAYLYCKGFPVSLSKLNSLQTSSTASHVCLTTLPAYPFDHTKSFWWESRINKDWRFRRDAKNPFLGVPVVDWNPLDARWRHFWKANDPSWIADHKIGSTILFPAAGMLVMAIEGARQLAVDADILAYEFRDVTFSSALEIPPESDGVETQLQVVPRQSTTTKQGSQFDFCLTARNPDWIEVCRGAIRIVNRKTRRNDVDPYDEEGYVSKRAMEIFEEVSNNCDSSLVAGHEIYSWLKKINYHYGPTFARVQNLRHSQAREAIGELELLPIEGLEKPSVIHPATLDGIIHPMVATMMQETTSSASDLGTAVPTRVDRLWISSDGLVESNTPNIDVAARSHILGHRMTQSNAVAFSKNHSLKVFIERMEAMAISDVPDVSSASSNVTQRLCWDVVYKPDVSALAPSQLRRHVLAELPKNLLWPQFFFNLESMLHKYLIKASHDVSDAGSAAQSTHCQGYFQWMLKKLSTSSSGLALDSNPTGGQITSTPPPESEPKEARQILDVFRHVGHNLVGVLKGQVDPLGLLFQDTLMDDFYDLLLETADYQAPLARYLDLLAHKYPSMNILEIGAGTGGTTKRILQTLAQQGTNGRSARYSNYSFTDISPSFFEKAEEKLQAFPKVQYKVLDIEFDAVEQGFEAESFDLIVASLVLHATKSLDQSLTNLRRLLKPGGKLILCEITHPDSIRAGFVFGILPGWWLSGEKYRQERLSPCITEHDWHQVLKSNGFSGCDQVFYDQESDHFRTTSIVLSTKLEVAATDQHGELKSASIICTAEEDNLLVRACQKHVGSYGISPRLTTFKDADAAELPASEELVIVCDIGETSLVQNLGQADFDPFCRILSRANHVLWILPAYKDAPDGPSRSSIVGLARVLRAEHQFLNFTLLELCDPSSLQGQGVNLARVVRQCLSASITQPFEDEIRDKDGMLHIPRVVEDVHLNSVVFEDAMPLLQREVRFGSANLRLTIQTPGLLDTLTFTEMPPPPEALLSHEIQVSVKAVGVNFRDCLGALGRIPDDNFGTECAGIVERVGSACSLRPGDRVMVLSPCAFSSSPRCNEKYAVKIPSDLPFAEAAKIPTNFGTAYMALVKVGRIRKGETVLIHAGAGGTGQAAVQIAKCFGAEIFVTVGSEQKKKLVMELYKIPADHIFYSRDVSFAEGIMHYTKGRGVDLVLNSLAGDELRASWECIAPFGRFLEIGKRDIYQHEKMPMFPFARNVTFSAVDLASMEERIELVRATLEAVVELIEQKKIHVASPLEVFSLHQIEDAFRYLQSGNNAGAVAVEVDPDTTVQALVTPSRKPIFKSDATYVIAGGFGGQGLSIARWMAINGAKNLLMLSRQGRYAMGAEEFIEEMRAAGVHIEAPACDITVASCLQEALEAAAKAKMAPIKGCIQAAMVIHDSLFNKMTYETWHASTDVKIAGSWNLHTHLPSNLDFFILLSSIGGIIGSAGQSNYSAGNAYLDALAAYRLSLGQKAISLNLSAMSEAGFFVTREKMLDLMIKTKQVIPMTQADLFAVLRYYCDPDIRLEDMKSQLVMGLTLPVEMKRAGHDMAYMYRSFFSQLHQLDSLDSTTATASSERSGQLDLNALRAAKSKSAAAQMLTTALQAKLSKVFSSNAEELDVTRPLYAYGVDSLVAVELRNWFLKTLKVDIPVFEILGGATIEGLGSSLTEKMGFDEGE